MQSKATTVEKYLAELPADRRAAISAVRDVILKNLDRDYEEGMQYGSISYFVPHRVFPAGYHCDPSKPLCFAGLASQKNHMAVYLMCVYGGAEHAKWFQDAWAKSGKKLDMGKSCIRFKKIEDLALDVIGESIRRVPAKKYVENYLGTREMLSQRTKKGPPDRPAKAQTKSKSTTARRPAARTKAASRR